MPPLLRVDHAVDVTQNAHCFPFQVIAYFSKDLGVWVNSRLTLFDVINLVNIIIGRGH